MPGTTVERSLQRCWPGREARRLRSSPRVLGVEAGVQDRESLAGVALARLTPVRLTTPPWAQQATHSVPPPQAGPGGIHPGVATPCSSEGPREARATQRLSHETHQRQLPPGGRVPQEGSLGAGDPAHSCEYPRKGLQSCLRWGRGCRTEGGGRRLPDTAPHLGFLVPTAWKPAAPRAGVPTQRPVLEGPPP